MMATILTSEMVDSADVSTKLGRAMLQDYLAECGIDCPADVVTAFRFFWEHAPCSHDPARETREEGRARGAVSLALAEKWARDEWCEVDWEEDREGGPDEEVCIVRHPDGRYQTLCGIDAPDNAYRRVVFAQLALDIQGQGEVTEYVFHCDHWRKSIVVERERSDYLTFIDRHIASDRPVKSVDVIDNHDEDARYWIVYVADCFDPPYLIIAADSVEDAIDIFVDESPYARIAPEDLAEFDEEHISYSDISIPYDGESIHVESVRLTDKIRRKD